MNGSSCTMNCNVILRRPRICVFFLCVAMLVVYVYYLNQTINSWNDTYIVKFVNTKLSLLGKTRNKAIIIRQKNPGLILDTPGCKIPKLNPFDSSVANLFEEKGPYDCSGPPLFIYSQPGGSIGINETVLKAYYNLSVKQIFCVYQGIYRKPEKKGNVRENDYGFTDYEILNFNVTLNQDHVFVMCDLGGKENFTHYFPLVPLKKDVEEEKTKISPPTRHLNVILTGVDSISKLNFLRHFKKTHEFIKTKGNWFDMKGYVKVGDNTFPNLTPLLTGQHVEAIWNETLKDTMFFDDVDIIWKRYSKRGFRTFYAEDSPYFGTFNYGRRGFNNTPSDYYMRPLYLAMHSSALRKKGSFYCFNSQLEPEIMYNYLRDFVATMGNRPYFAFAMQSSLTHDYFNYAGYADYTTVGLLEDLWDMGAMNNSVVIFYSDHGIRFGSIRNTYIGKYEERMPFLYIHFPTWFLEQNPQIHKNLKLNTERLVTFFDVYATMVHVLDPTKSYTDKEKAKISPYGLSFLDEISPYRTCVDAGIFPHWCTCQVMNYVSPTSREIVKSVQAVKDYLQNQILSFSKICADINIKEVKEAKLLQLNDLVLRFVKHENIIIDRSVWYSNRIVKYEDFLITFTTEPCDDTYEATVRHNVENDSYDVVDVDNIDYDLNEHSCLSSDQSLQKICCCA